MPARKLPLLMMLLLLTGCNTTPQDSTSDDAGVTTRSTPPQHTYVADQPLPALPTPHTSDDVWQRIRMQLSFASSTHPRVLKRVNWYLQHPNYMHTISNRAEPYLYYLVSEVERRGLPIELALMPLIESDFNAQAYSEKHASGLWQLTPLIAKHYGVTINPWFDGRQDLIQSTGAALDFLTYLHQRFDGDWYHAIAAYNTGEGRVATAIANNRKAGKPTDFFSLKLPRQTRHYVPKLLAAAALLKQQRMHFPAIDNQPAFIQLTMDQAVILPNTHDWAELAVLNPGFRRFPVLLSGPGHLLVPRDREQEWLQAAAQFQALPDTRWQQVTVRRGDSLSRIARQHGITVSEMRQFNQLNSNLIRIGQTLLLPSRSEKLDYVVKRGDSLWRIARQFGVSVKDLKRWNQRDSNQLRLGETLAIHLTAP
ncbi:MULTISPECIES: LysM peptidoglycan-binding domain-containing protein [unclassified Pseudoalteromonas]|uniref:LysM peptidoglycan-binding domain-containing protein n=1 Tax=unclassified Pseudoalteromonas TaxID=194690 RepID=UPI002098444D|nr:LysM peptidoglycan-binding domain-containing protein [Pseudoalteromonas sp. XMcav2-N]MCO7190178.1 LysM peptidoglycan-binding domain-containing protein [Pseudoalteromonas sp. XMcav2-N]